MISTCEYSMAFEKYLKENKDAIYKAVLQSDKAIEMNKARDNNADFKEFKTNHKGEKMSEFKIALIPDNQVTTLILSNKSEPELNPEFKAIEKAVYNAFSEIMAVTFSIQRTGDKTLIALDTAIHDAVRRINEMRKEKDIT